MNGHAHALALTEQEIGAVLKFCGQEALLVGGQALAVWAQFFVVEPTGELADKVTLHVDFVGSREVAKALSAALRWRLYVPPVEDSTPQTAKVSITLPDGGIKQIDFLNSIAGLDTNRRRLEQHGRESRGATRPSSPTRSFILPDSTNLQPASPLVPMPCKPSRPRPMHCWLKRTNIANSPPPLLIRTD